MNTLAYVVIVVLAALVVLLVKHVRKNEADIETLYGLVRNKPEPGTVNPYQNTDTVNLAVQRHVRDYH